MRTIRKIFILAAVAGLFAACQQDDIEPDVPDTPTVGRHLRFSGSAGNDNAATRASWEDRNNGKLTFAWDYSASDATTSELKMAFIRNGVCLSTVKGNRVADMKILQHTDEEKSTNKHWAEFEDIEGFDPEMPDSEYDGHTVHAITPIHATNGSDVNVDDNGTFTATLNMPTTFTQSGENNLEHLSDYLYMYAESVLANGTASLTFDHLAAYVRFKVYNWRGVPATLYGVKLEVVDADGNTDTASGVQADYADDGFVYTPATAGQGVQVDITDGSIATDGSIFLYAPVFPVGSENSFEGKTLRFTIIAQDPTGAAEQGKYEYFTYELKGETFKSVTGSYDWIPGDLYTFHLYLDDVLKVPEVTVNDWIETDIDGGVAEEVVTE